MLESDVTSLLNGRVSVIQTDNYRCIITTTTPRFFGELYTTIREMKQTGKHETCIKKVTLSWSSGLCSVSRRSMHGSIVECLLRCDYRSFADALDYLEFIYGKVALFECE
jgi:hypothetical protein